MRDETRLEQWLGSRQEQWEARCHNCGACCGAFEDPCSHLRKGPDAKYFCEIYDHRFGERMTVSGKVFTCVPIRQKLHSSWPGDEACGYKISSLKI